MKRSTAAALSIAIVSALTTAGLAKSDASGADKTFATKFAAGGQDEIALAKIALTRSKNADVRSFANKMIADHTKAGKQLAAIAQTDSLAVPASPDAQGVATAKKLQATADAKFDLAYRQANKVGHAMALRLLQTEVSSGHDPNLIAYAKNAMPTVREHASLVEGLPTT